MVLVFKRDKSRLSTRYQQSWQVFAKYEPEEALRHTRQFLPPRLLNSRISDDRKILIIVDCREPYPFICKPANEVIFDQSSGSSSPAMALWLRAVLHEKLQMERDLLRDEATFERDLR